MKAVLALVTAAICATGTIVTIGVAAAVYVPLGEPAVVLVFLVGMAATASVTIILSMLVRIAYREPPRSH